MSVLTQGYDMAMAQEKGLSTIDVSVLTQGYDMAMAQQKGFSTIEIS